MRCDASHSQAIFHFGTPMGIILRAAFSNGHNLLAVLSETGCISFLYWIPNPTLRGTRQQKLRVHRVVLVKVVILLMWPTRHPTPKQRPIRSIPPPPPPLAPR